MSVLIWRDACFIR